MRIAGTRFDLQPNNTWWRKIYLDTSVIWNIVHSTYGSLILLQRFHELWSHFTQSKVSLVKELIEYLHYCWCCYKRKSRFDLEWDNLYLWLKKRIVTQLAYTKNVCCSVLYYFLKFVTLIVINFVYNQVLLYNEIFGIPCSHGNTIDCVKSFNIWNTAF